MKYKALMLDVDGTLIPYDYDALPSDKVTAAIKKIKDSVHISLVTGRSLGSLVPMLSKLGIKDGFAVLDNGARVADIRTKRLLYDQPMNIEDAKEVARYFHEHNIPFYLKQDLMYSVSKYGPTKIDEQISTPYMFYFNDSFLPQEVDKIFKDLSHLDNLKLYKVQHKDPNLYGMNICHVNATKLHGVVAIMEELKLKKTEVVGIGDGYNDFPLLMAAGLKIAMGNAVTELKDIADFVAPSVDDDGLATVIEKFFL